MLGLGGLGVEDSGVLQPEGPWHRREPPKSSSSYAFVKEFPISYNMEMRQ